MIAKIAVALLAAVNLLFGVIALTSPGRVARFIGLETTSASARGELRAVFGGLVIALAVLMVVALRRDDGPAILRTVAVIFAGLAAGRVVSLAADGVNAYTAIALLLEGGTAALLAWAAKVVGAAAG